MSEHTYFKTRIRAKGQITIPGHIRELLKVTEGDDLAFYINEQDQVVVERLQVVPPEQAWFWSKRWQQMERKAQADIDAGRVLEFDDVEAAIQHLHALADTEDADAED